MKFTLSNQVQIPAVGIGTFMMTPDQAEQAVVDALACGYRMIDTAQAYMNERAVGRGIKRSGVSREDIFISTKIWASQYLTEGTVESLQPYGAFVNLGNGLSGLVHISQISEKRIKHPSAVLAVGDKVKVKVIAVKDGKLSLSMKALQDVAAQEIEEEVYELPETEEATTTLGSLFANIKLS